jgi:hypothetical protein
MLQAAKKMQKKSLISKAESKLEKNEDEQLVELPLDTGIELKKQPKVLCLYVSLPEEIAKETLESIKTQSLPVSKLVLVNERSSKPSLGERLSEVINNALSKVDIAKYDYILRVDSNNILPLNFLEANLAVEPDIMGFGSPQIIKVKPFLEIMSGRINPLQDNTYIRHKFAMHGLRVAAPVVKADLKRKAVTLHNLDQYKRRLELVGGIETWVPIEKQKTLGDRFRSATKRLRHALVFGTMEFLTPKLRDGVKDWLTYRAKTPRPFTLFLKQYFGEKPVAGAEIGFGFGFNALSFLQELSIERLYCIDPLEIYANKFGDAVVDYFDPSVGLYPQLSKDHRVHFVKLASDQAFAWGRMPRDLDFVYVDGLHTADQAFRDIINGFEYVRVGGVVGGHDFTREYENSVLPAVFRVAAETGLVPTIKMPDFWFVKAGN